MGLVPEFFLFELPHPTRVFCGPPLSLFDLSNPRSYTTDDVLSWCAMNRCDVDKTLAIYLIMPRDTVAAFAFRMRWL